MVDKKIMWLSFIGSVVYLRASKSISMMDVALALLSSTIRLEARRISLRHSTAIVTQAEIASETALCSVLWLTTSFERGTFMNSFSDMKLLAPCGLLASLAFILSASSASATKQSKIVSASLLCGVTSAIFTTSGIHLLLALISVVFVAIAAHNRTEEEELIDQHYNDIITPRIIQHHDQYAHQKLAGVIALTFLLFLAHLQSQNNYPSVSNTQQTIEIKTTTQIPSIDFNDRGMHDGVRKQLRHQCLHKARALYIERVGAMIKPNKNFAIVHYPDHWNLGDAFIYHGQTTMWHVYGQLFQRAPTTGSNYNAFAQIITVSTCIFHQIYA
jgi:hypothetical protein